MHFLFNLINNLIRRFYQFGVWLKTKVDTENNKEYKRNILTAIPFWVGAGITGLVAVAYSWLFNLAENTGMYIFTHVPWMIFIITPLSFFFAWFVVAKYSPFARGSGIPQVTAAIILATPKHNHLINMLLGARILFFKIVSSLLMIFGGGIIGREGPTIQISASIFKKINDFLPHWYPKISKRNMLVTGAAAGLAAAFNTPLGGIVFAIEELTKTHFSYFKSALLVGVIISGLTALNILGPYLYLGYPFLDDISAWMFFIVLPVAIIGGAAGSGMGRAILFMFSKKRKHLKSKFKRYAFPILCGLLIAATGYFLDLHVMGSGKQIMAETLFNADKHLPWYVPFLRIGGNIISFAIGASGGIFAPSLSAGASIGAVVAELFHLGASDANLMILCGMTACLTGITRSPFTASILVIEMTNSHTIIFYIMLSALFSNIVATAVSRQAFYDVLKEKFLDEVIPDKAERDMQE